MWHYGTFRVKSCHDHQISVLESCHVDIAYSLMDTDKVNTPEAMYYINI